MSDIIPLTLKGGTWCPPDKACLDLQAPESFGSILSNPFLKEIHVLPRAVSKYSFRHSLFLIEVCDLQSPRIKYPVLACSTVQNPALFEISFNNSAVLYGQSMYPMPPVFSNLFGLKFALISFSSVVLRIKSGCSWFQVICQSASGLLLLPSFWMTKAALWHFSWCWCKMNEKTFWSQRDLCRHWHMAIGSRVGFISFKGSRSLSLARVEYPVLPL